MNAVILDVIAKAIGGEPTYLSTVEEDMPLAAMGFTSQNYMMCLFDLEEEIQVVFEDESSLFMNVKTWGDLCKLIGNTMNEAV